jgi:Domain of unknown function (DUF4440)
MRIGPFRSFSLAFAALSLSLPLRAAEPPAAFSIPNGDVLTAAIRAQDAALFEAVFVACDADAVKNMVTDDLEFYHDKWGKIADSGASFAAKIAQGCERQTAGADYRARRELISDTLRVYPLNDYGALESGEHRFYKLEKDGSLECTETSKFSMLWAYRDGEWRLARVISYDHSDRC